MGVIGRSPITPIHHLCAQDWTRTSTPLRAPAPQAGVSTNFTTWADSVFCSKTLVRFFLKSAANIYKNNKLHHN